MAIPVRRGTVGVSSYTETGLAGSPLHLVAGCTWIGRPGGHRLLRVLPDGCVDLVCDGREVIVFGPGTGPTWHRVTGPSVGIRLRPGAAGALLGTAACDIPATGVDVAAIMPSGRLAVRSRGDTPGQRVQALCELLLSRLRDGHVPDRSVMAAASSMSAAGAPSAARLADRLGVTTRQVLRRFRAEVGLAPAQVNRIGRFGRFLDLLPLLASGRMTIATAAADSGYADQAHLARECRALSGQAPRALVRSWTSDSFKSPAGRHA